ncbi:unnamed protein product, partial [Mesorhabditis belari]|uniref:Uncharacterized protein n=1 Tax=Mesorhabditis belari TaxID=2138241 RepID=A0AAF3EDB8_9BILA
MHLSNLLSLMITSKTRKGGNLSTFWFLPFLLLLSLNACQAEEETEEVYNPLESLEAHGGIFRELPWTKEELRMISSLHATTEYGRLMTLIKEKLIEAADELRPETRHKIEKFLKTSRPPSVMRHFLTERERKQVRQLHANHNIGEVLVIYGEALERLPVPFKNEAIRYLDLPNSPKILP